MNPDEVLKLVAMNLEKLGIAYMVGGSMASAAYGVPRATLDADLVVDLRSEHAENFVNVFEKEFYVDRGQIEQALRTKQAFNIVHLESSFKVDLFVLGERNFDREEFSRRRVHRREGASPIAIYFKTPEDIVLTKLEWSRRGGAVSEMQWRDVLGILKAQIGGIDLDYLRRWARELGVADLLENALGEAGT